MNIDATTLHAWATGFRDKFDDFVSFEESGQGYLELERAYKDELRALFDDLFAQLIRDDAEDAQWFDALVALLTTKLKSTGAAQNLVGWRITGSFKSMSLDQRAAGGAAIRELLTGGGALWSRFGAFSKAWREAQRIDDRAAPPAYARDIGTTLLALQDPLNACPVRYDVFDKASRALLGKSLFQNELSPSDELRSCLAFANAVFVGLRDNEGFAPRDLLDVQSFLWASVKYASDQSYASLFRRAFELLEPAKSGPFGEQSELWAAMEALKTRIEKAEPVTTRPNLIVQWTLGKGNWAKVPWIALLDRRVTSSTQAGVYVVLLVTSDLQRVYLSLNQGMTNLVNTLGQTAAVKAMEARTAEIRATYGELEKAGFSLASDMELRSTGWRPKNYEAGSIAHLALDLDHFPSDEEVEEALEVLLEVYDDIAVSTSAEARPSWFVGAVWDGDDQTDTFVSKGVWRNGYEEGPTLDEVLQMQPGDRIAIKSSFTQRHNLPFAYPEGKTASVMRIKAVGVVTENLGDGRTVKVQWEEGFGPRDWYFYTARDTVWAVRPGSNAQADQLLAFAFEGAEQDYEWFLSQSYWASDTPEPETVTAPTFTVDDALRDLFMGKDEFERILTVWRGKKNLVLQGAPGVGKSFVARRLAYALMGYKDERRVENIQFHQSYGYEDFVQGYRPTKDGGFILRDGVFHRFCEKARLDQDRPHVFIIDEINRGNLSKIFGELMLLIESDKRDDAWGVRLAYAEHDAEPFHIPANLFILGMMNTADRSLSLVDYALRRRFAFIGLEPQFSSSTFAPHLKALGVDSKTIERVVTGMRALNETIASDKSNLGPGFQIGHSFFTPTAPIASSSQWFETVIETEVRPLLEEYWFDEPKKADEWRERLLHA